MKAETAAPAGQCPTCGAEVADGTVGGLCARCFARGALHDDFGWLHAASAELPPGEVEWPVVTGWRITGELGAGGMGRVYRAESETDNASAAVKVLDTRWTNDAIMTARFEAEAGALMTLEHPHIVRMLELTEADDGRLCLVMEHVEGCDLGRLMRGEQISHERAMDIFGKTCAAVAYAHERGFVHRDIKPANILVGRDGGVKLGDFGVAKKMPDDGSGPSATIGGLTLTTDRFGSAYYLAPEVLLRAPGAGTGTSVDVYALGVLLYHLLTGQMPLGHYTPVSVLTGLSKAFDPVIAAALEPDPARRTGSVAQLSRSAANAWETHLRGAGRVRIHRRVLVGAGVLLLGAAAAVAGALWQRKHMPGETPRVFPPPASASSTMPWENGLGMRFVPVAGTRVLFSMHETRRSDALPFLQATEEMVAGTWRAPQRKEWSLPMYRLEVGGSLVPGATWDDPGFPVTPEHPVSFVTLRDAQHYCQWLTWKEQNEGRLKPGQYYRLPTSAEWFAACGGADAPLLPGNRAGPEARDEYWPATWPTFTERDDFPRLAPIGSFPAERHGLHDISGNVAEWTQDDPEDDKAAALRGPAFHDGTARMARYDHPRQRPNKARMPHIGFRVVLDWQTGTAARATP
ncbi:MAG: bifunctional serine/threonine-protein kinase/formylglycine-generating enzyme family protein [Prosthecobacter sp.]